MPLVCLGRYNTTLETAILKPGCKMFDARHAWPRVRFFAYALLGIVSIVLNTAWAADPPDAAPADSAAPAAGNGGGGNGLLNMDLDQLSKVDVKVPALDVEVTSVTKQESTVGRSPAAVFVITQEMIRRSGATNIPEALRMAPGRRRGPHHNELRGRSVFAASTVSTPTSSWC